jgi:hypothetical protein
MNPKPCDIRPSVLPLYIHTYIHTYIHSNCNIQSLTAAYNYAEQFPTIVRTIRNPAGMRASTREGKDTIRTRTGTMVRRIGRRREQSY